MLILSHVKFVNICMTSTQRVRPDLWLAWPELWLDLFGSHHGHLGLAWDLKVKTWGSHVTCTCVTDSHLWASGACEAVFWWASDWFAQVTCESSLLWVICWFTARLHSKEKKGANWNKHNPQGWYSDSLDVSLDECRWNRSCTEKWLRVWTSPLKLPG